MAVYHTNTNESLTEPITRRTIHNINPYFKQRTYLSPCSVFLCILTYLLFGYMCANATLLIMLDRNCSLAINETRTHLIIDFETKEGRQILWFNEALSMFILSILATYRTCRYLH